MKMYIVQCKIQGYATIKVEAESKIDALNKALEMADNSHIDTWEPVRRDADIMEEYEDA